MTSIVLTSLKEPAALVGTKLSAELLRIAGRLAELQARYTQTDTEYYQLRNLCENVKAIAGQHMEVINDE